MLRLVAILIALAVALTAIRRILKIAMGFWAGFGQPDAPPFASGKAESVALVQDPVCGTYLAMDAALKRVSGGRTVYFCSPECRDKFAGKAI